MEGDSVSERVCKIVFVVVDNKVRFKSISPRFDLGDAGEGGERTGDDRGES